MNQIALELDEKLRQLDPAEARRLELLVRDVLDRADDVCADTPTSKGNGKSSESSRGNLPELEWSEELNARRCALIDRKIQGELTAQESDELDHLQQALRQYINRVAPLPFEAARQLHADLLQKQQAKQ